MKRTQHILFISAVVPLTIVALAVVLFETDLLPCGVLRGQQVDFEFVAAVAMEILTIAFIPLALKLFKLRAVAKRLRTPQALLCLGSLRLAMLTVPMVVNTLLYYLFMNVAFGYLAIILALCIFFVFPSMSRCEAEVGMGGDEEGLGDAAGEPADAAGNHSDAAGELGDNNEGKSAL